MFEQREVSLRWAEGRQLAEQRGGHVLAGGRLEVMCWQCRFMQAASALTDSNQRQRIHVAIARSGGCRRQGDAGKRNPGGGRICLEQWERWVEAVVVWLIVLVLVLVVTM